MYIQLCKRQLVKKHIQKGTKNEKERLSRRFARLEAGHAPQARRAAFVFSL